MKCVVLTVTTRWRSLTISMVESPFPAHTQGPGFDLQNHRIFRVHMLAVRGHLLTLESHFCPTGFSFWASFANMHPLPPATYLLHLSHNCWLLPPLPQQAVAGGQGPPGNRDLQCGALPGSPQWVLSSPPGLGQQPLDSQGHLEEPLWREKKVLGLS